jgi:UDP-N-acetylmuramoyl-L-alanyl-D-glutamate--2,6-diaminopimelate ligase
VVVDFAHSPDALERSLRSLKALSQGKVLVVFGCGGDRDQGKRPQMGAVAESLADVVIITDDNPRTEPAEEIVQQIQSGMNHPGRVIHDRKQAVSEAIRSAKAGDIVLVAGKGHEETQSVSGHRIHLSDREFVVELLEELQ